MGKGQNKLQKFAEYDSFSNTFSKTDDTKGQWAEIFGNHHPIIVELATGKGDYTLGLARMNPQINYIGIDIKGNRLWKGAKIALDESLHNVRFLRIAIEQIEDHFNPNEVSEFWITFPDPQPHKWHKRLVSGRFLNAYRKVSKSPCLVNVKTDSTLFYQSTLEQIAEDNLTIHQNISDVYALNPVPDFLNIQTFYENIWLAEGKKIKYIKFDLGTVVSDETRKPQPSKDKLP
jgi:tRNA (guanine-N7-)-methyltransferase